MSYSENSSWEINLTKQLYFEDRLRDIFPKFLFLAMISRCPWKSYFHPVFGCRNFPIHFYTNARKREYITYLEAIFDSYKKLTKEDCLAYHSYIKRKFKNYNFPLDLSGKCLGSDKCRIIRFTCYTCGRIFIPKVVAIEDQNFKNLPFWYPYIYNEIIDFSKKNEVTNSEMLVLTSSNIIKVVKGKKCNKGEQYA